MAQRSIYLIVRVDIEVPDNCELSDFELATDLGLSGITYPEDDNIHVEDYEICGLNDF